MWGAVKISLNSSLGTDEFMPIDKIMNVVEYESFYKSMYASVYYGIGRGATSSPYIDVSAKTHIENGDILVPAGMDHFDVIIAPWVETLGDSAISAADGYIASECALNVFLPPRLKYIGNNAIVGSKLPLIIPEGVKNIFTGGFSMLDENQKVIIKNKKGSVLTDKGIYIDGESWGHPGGSSMIEYLY